MYTYYVFISIYIYVYTHVCCVKLQLYVYSTVSRAYWLIANCFELDTGPTTQLLFGCESGQECPEIMATYPSNAPPPQE